MFSEVKFLFDDEISRYWKFPAMSRLHHFSRFRARITVSTKEFLWDPSFNFNSIFSGILDP